MRKDNQLLRAAKKHIPPIHYTENRARLTQNNLMHWFLCGCPVKVKD